MAQFRELHVIYNNKVVSMTGKCRNHKLQTATITDYRLTHGIMGLRHKNTNKQAKANT